MGNFDPAIIFIILLVMLIGVFVYAVVISKKLKEMTIKYDKFMRGKDAETLEDVILERFEQVDTLITENETKTKQITEIFENLKTTVQKCGIVKYDAFHEMGGKLSFSMAMLDDKNNGFILTSVHTREGCYTYVKEIIKGESFVVLSEEERSALEEAKNKRNYMA